MATNAELYRATPKLTTRRHRGSATLLTHNPPKQQPTKSAKRLKVLRTLSRNRSEGPGRQSGPRFSFLGRAGYGVGSGPPGVGPTMGGMVGGGAIRGRSLAAQALRR